MAKSSLQTYYDMMMENGDGTKGSMSRVQEPKSDIKRDVEFSKSEQDWNDKYLPEVQRLGALGERDALSAFQQEKAKALAQLGYARSSGTGGSGGYNAAQIALERGSQQQLGNISRSAEMYELGAYLKYMDREDQQSHQLDAMKAQYEYQMEIAKQNSASWWEGLTSLAGMGLAIWQPWNKTTQEVVKKVY